MYIYKVQAVSRDAKHRYSGRKVRANAATHLLYVPLTHLVSSTLSTALRYSLETFRRMEPWFFSSLLPSLSFLSTFLSPRCRFPLLRVSQGTKIRVGWPPRPSEREGSFRNPAGWFFPFVSPRKMGGPEGVQGVSYMRVQRPLIWNTYTRGYSASLYLTRMQISSILDFSWMRRSGGWWLVLRCSHFSIFSLSFSPHLRLLSLSLSPSLSIFRFIFFLTAFHSSLSLVYAPLT